MTVVTGVGTPTPVYNGVRQGRSTDPGHDLARFLTACGLALAQRCRRGNSWKSFGLSLPFH